MDFLSIINVVQWVGAALLTILLTALPIIIIATLASNAPSGNGA